MLGRAALLILLGTVTACEAPPQAKLPAPLPAPEEPAVVLSAQQIHERSEQCGKASRDEFRRAWEEGTAASAETRDRADFAYHYNAKLDTCFYLLTVNHSASDRQGGAPEGTMRKMLVAINEREVYGEYLGLPATGSPPDVFPTDCRVVSMYCASEREWEVLVSEFMED